MKNLIRKIYSRAVAGKAGEQPGWKGDYASWADASARCTGYDHDLIFEKVKSAALKVVKGEAAFERDSVTFREIEFVPEFLEILLSVAAEKNNSLSVLDFGGSLGSVYFQHRSLLASLTSLWWNVVEQKHFVEFGKKELVNGQLDFYFTIGDCLQHHQPHLLLLSSVISYLQQPYAFLEEAKHYNFDYILIDRNIFINDSRDRLCRQVVPKEIHKASYPCWLLAKDNIAKALSPGYDLVSEFDPYGQSLVEIEGGTAFFKALLFKRIKND